MLARSLTEVFDKAATFSADNGPIVNWSLLLPPAILTAFCLWRIWRFWVRPHLYPNDPREIPHWVPFIGHGISFFRSSHDLIETGLNQLGCTYEPFALQVGSETLYIVTAPNDVTEVYKKPDDLAWEPHLNQLFLNFGFNPESLKRAWERPIITDPRYGEINPQQHSLIHLIERIYMKQLLPGPEMDDLGQNFRTALEAALQFPKLQACGIRVTEKASTISLLRLCQNSLLEADLTAFFGKSVMGFDEALIPNLLNFNEHAWMLFYGLPSRFASKVLTPQSAVLEVLQQFASLPGDMRRDQSWSVQQVLDAMEFIGIDLRSKACILLQILWAANSNVNNAAFWMTAYILFDENLRGKVKQEINSAWTSGDLNVKHLCANAPFLDRLFHECLRTSGGAMMGRKVMRATHIGGKLLRPGGMVLIPSRQLHSNANIWGANHQDFNESRFAKNPSLLRHSSYRPFGGGVSLCPGRKIAKEQILTFVAILLHDFDIRLNRETAQQFPKLNAKAASLGVTGPAKGMDLSVDMTFSGTNM